jgi:hypothetical protein
VTSLTSRNDKRWTAVAHVMNRLGTADYADRADIFRAPFTSDPPTDSLPPVCGDFTVAKSGEVARWGAALVIGIP